VAYLALPSICYNLDQSSRAFPQATSHGRSANIYQDFLRVLQLRYEGTDRALDNMSKLMSNMNVEDATTPSTARSGSEHSPVAQVEPMRSSGRSVLAKNGSGIDIVVSEPQKYIRMSYTLDFFLSHGRFPTIGDIPPSLLSSSGNPEGWTTTGAMNNLNGVGGVGTMARVHHSQHGTSDGTNQVAIRNSVWAVSSPGSNNVGASSEARTGSPQLSDMLANDPFGQGGIDPDGYSFEDFMTDGPLTGIEQLQNVLHRYPGWP